MDYPEVPIGNVRVDLRGKKFSMLTVLYRTENPCKNPATYYACRCDCGKITRYSASNLIREDGLVKSCGCHKKERAKHIVENYGHTRKHGLALTRLSRIWRGMKGRCTNPNSPSYKDYGGRGITVCEEWMHDLQAFADWAYANGYSDSLSIDRIDPNGNYCPENCRWADMMTQANNKRNVKLYTIDGVSHTLPEWCRIYGIRSSKVHARLYAGWSVVDAFTAE